MHDAEAAAAEAITTTVEGLPTLQLPPKCRMLKLLLPNRTLQQPAADAAVTTNEQQREDAPGCVFPKDRNHHR